MSLEIRKSHVRRIEDGTPTSLREGVLRLDTAELRAELLALDPCIGDASVHIALPGSPTRVLCTKDAIEPRFKLEGHVAGDGITFALSGMAVITCGPIVGFQEGIIDMSGVGAAYSPFSELSLVVFEIVVIDGTDPHAHEAAVRKAGLHGALHIAQACSDCSEYESEVLAWDAPDPSASLPRIAYLDMVLSQELLHDTYVLGENALDCLPCKIDPRIVLDSGVVSGNCVSACDKTTTFHHQNNPIIAELISGHGRSWDFRGVILTNSPTRLAQKRSSADQSIELVSQLGVDGVIISKEGFGNPDADLMMLIEGLERAGISTVAITDEYAGPDGGSQSLADSVPEANALVSTGNANQRLVLPPMSCVIGPVPDVARIAGGYAQSVHSDGSIEVELQAIVGSTNQLGFGRLACREI